MTLPNPAFFAQFDHAQLDAADKAHYMHGFHMFDEHREQGSLNIAAGDGAYIYDTAGNRYLDAVGGMWCTNIGLGREEMADAIANQVRQLAYSNPFCDMANVTAIELCAKLASLAPGDLDHVFLTTGGSTAVDTAYRLVQFYQNSRGKHEKKHIISRFSAYHGSTFLTMSIGNKAADRAPEFDFMSDLFHHISCPNYYRAPAGMSEAQFLDFLVDEFEDKILTIGADKVAAFFAEPIMGSGGVIIPPKRYHRRMWEICQRYDLLYVADEVVTSFGRLGKFFASQEVFDMQPDIITTAKGLTSGYLPLGACIFSDRIWQVIGEPGKGRCFTHGFTYSGHPVSCVAALKNIEIIERENLLAHVEDVGVYLEQRLQTLASLPLVGDVRCQRLMACIEFVADKHTKALLPDAVNIGEKIHLRAQAKGLLVRPIGHLNVMSPPLIITHAQVDEVVEILRQCILDTAQELRQSGEYQGR
ncbi:MULTISPECIES: aminotransferase [unclassified Pseudomonas]|uniref:aminotransferase n=1 Tax=unclassified Pseudomonas TaxID=196821 RepID=UPI0015A09149|nr:MULTISPECIES: aminotransferase [unclassified Pseudomonas]NWC94450.1 aminotransferase [Pseudomonas sp. IPO3779]NWD19011.1 aminotransferase [Pseudomonas sp. IPO3778]